jgi:hypothetical protein
MLHLAGALALSTLLVACGEEQTAQNNPAQNSPAQSSAAQNNAAQNNATRDTSATASASTSTTRTATPVAPVAPEGTARSVAPPADETTGSINKTDTRSAAGTAKFDAVIGKSFNGGPVTLQLGNDQRFTMRDRNGQTVTGRYAHADGVITFQDGRGETAGARFPMRCRFESGENNGFRLADIDGSCPHFADVTFRPGT